MNLFSQLEWLNVNALLRSALQEDLGQGDITTAATVAPGQRGRADIIVKEAPHIVFCGGVLLAEIFRLAGAVPEIAACAYEGRILERGDTAAVVEGRLGGLLIGERTALNLMQLMSGIATMTRRYVDAVAGTGARIIDTRKTHPGLRTIEKYAVRAGGGFNHRFGLDSGVLIKENHIAAAGSVTAAFKGARKLAPHTMRIEIECETLTQVEEALAAGADSILLDNMTLDEVRRARAMAPAGRVLLEVSGGVTLDGLRAIAETGVDLISVGALTHSAPAVDLSMLIKPQ
ncbi:MAG TPA: carboxylating nicotinate-nucleotide diphosphorylase [Candidatus Binataceae bacterium]